MTRLIALLAVAASPFPSSAEEPSTRQIENFLRTRLPKEDISDFCSFTIKFDDGKLIQNYRGNDGSIWSYTIPLSKMNPNSVSITRSRDGDFFVYINARNDEKVIRISTKTYRNSDQIFYLKNLASARQAALAFRELIKRNGGRGELFQKEPKEIPVKYLPLLKSAKSSKSLYSVGDKVGYGTGLAAFVHGWRGTVISVSGKSYRIKLYAAASQSGYREGKTYEFTESEIEGRVD